MVKKRLHIPTYALRERATIITQTPMRVTLGGGGTDVIWYSRIRGGAWISAAIDRAVTTFPCSVFLMKLSYDLPTLSSARWTPSGAPVILTLSSVSAMSVLFAALVVVPDHALAIG